MINKMIKLLPAKSDWLYDFIFKFHSKHLLIIQLHKTIV